MSDPVLTKSELIEFLKENLCINIEVVAGFYGEGNKIKVCLTLMGIEITDDYIDMPYQNSTWE